MIEYLSGNRSYAAYFESGRLATSLLNLAELYYRVLFERGKDEAESTYTAFRAYQGEITHEDITLGMQLRLRRRAGGSNLSYTDAIGYAMSERMGLRFLTGDKAFKAMGNVEFVK